MTDLPKITRSDALWARAQGLIPAGTQTLAKGPGQHVRGVAPKYLQRAKGCFVWDVDGNRYLDTTMAVGPLSLGYGDSEVDAAIRAQLDDGITFSLMHPLEVEVAEQLRALVPGAESVRFSKTGADVTSAAVRLARAFTGRRQVLCCGYHGWHDWYIGVTDRDRGVPAELAALTWTIPYNDLAAAEEGLAGGDVACVILEPTVFEAPREGYLEGLRALCDRHGALLVFDEMWTGFRLHLGGAQARYGVRADLATFSKALANGMPLSALTGRRDVMALLEREVFFFTTFGGEALSLAAARATLRALEEREVPAYLGAQGRRLREGFAEVTRALDAGFVRLVGMDARTMAVFDPAAGDALHLKSLTQQELLRRGVLWQGFHNLSWAHRDEHIDALLAAWRGALEVVRDNLRDPLAALRGEPVEPVFRRTSNFDLRPRGGGGAR